MSPERTPEEREAARLERERRRARRAGRTPPPEPEPVTYEAEPEAQVEPEVDEFEAAPEVFEAAPEEFEAAPEEFEAAPEVSEAAPEEFEAAPEVSDGSRRLVRIATGPQLHGAPEPPPPAPPEPPPARRRSRARARPRKHHAIHRPHSIRGRVGALVALVLAAALIWFLVELFQPVHGSGHGSITVTIPAHSSSSKIGDLLARDGVISSSFFFELRATLAGERGSMRPGTYHLKLGMSYGSVLDILTRAPKAAPVTSLTITEGRTRRSISALLHSQGVRGSYLAATRHSRLLDPHRYGAPRDTPSLEGFLFPSTYQLVEPISIRALVADQLRTFRQRFATVNLNYARGKHLTPYDVLTIASMVQGESPSARDLPLIASVIYNRLRRGMLLQMDSTVRYAVDNYTTPITQSQLRSSSPWNTYVHAGPPPTPIDNPGLAAIEAAAHPARTNYLFFVAKPCGNGTSLFASSYPQFLREENAYRSARAKRGGRSPTKCG